MEPIIFEPWLHNIIQEKLQKDNEFRLMMGKESLPLVTRADIDRYHLFLFKQTLAYAAEKSVFYRNLLKKAGITADDIHSIADITRVPFTTPDDIAANPYHFACVSLGNITSITTFASSGTTGPQKKVFITDADLERMTDFMAVGMKTVAKSGDVVQIMLPATRPNNQSGLLALGVKKMGGTPAITGNALTPVEQIRKIDENRPAVLFTETAYIWRITQETFRRFDLKSKNVKTIFITAEHLSEAARQQLQNVWGCNVCAHYGMTEMGLGVSIECDAHDGYHYNERDLMVEVIDPDTGEVLPDGAEGEVVFSAFNREAMPLLRYRTHDISKLIRTPCKCGASTLQKIAPVTRRQEAIVKINGDELYPALFDELLFTIPDIIDYQLTVSKQSNKDTLTFKVEVTEQDKTILKTINEKLLSHPVLRKNREAGKLELSPIELVHQGALTRLSRAKRLILDTRG